MLRISALILVLASSLTACLDDGTGIGGGGVGGGGPPVDDDTSDPTGKLDADELDLENELPDEPTCSSLRAGDDSCLP